MAEIRVEAGFHDALSDTNGMDANYWYATAFIGGEAHSDAAAPTVDLALHALALKLATQIEDANV